MPHFNHIPRLRRGGGVEGHAEPVKPMWPRVDRSGQGKLSNAAANDRASGPVSSPARPASSIHISEPPGGASRLHVGSGSGNLGIYTRTSGGGGSVHIPEGAGFSSGGTPSVAVLSHTHFQPPAPSLLPPTRFRLPRSSCRKRRDPSAAGRGGLSHSEEKRG